MRNLNSIAKIVSIVLSLAPVAWSDTPLVTAHYDNKNNWFVFEWTNTDTGKKQSIYDSANKIKPEIHAQASMDATSGVYTYNYDVANLSGAVQLLEQVFVPHPAAILEPVNPSDWRGSEYRNQNVWAWHRVGTLHGLPSGEIARGFSFKSKGLPTIVTASFAGVRRVEYTIPSPDNDSDSVQASFEQVFSNLQAKYPDKFTDRVYLKTIAPIDPPANFVAKDFIVYMLSLERQAASLGWISDQGISKSLATELDKAEKKIVVCKIKTATNLVQTFLNEVREPKGREGKYKDDKREHLKMTSEGYALMYYNGKYLLTQLENKTNLNCPPDRDDSHDDADDRKPIDRSGN